MFAQVESLNEETLSSYLEYLEYNFPLNPEDWTRLETRSRELIKDAPKLQVSSLQVHCENDKFLKKYLKARVYFFNSPSYFLETNYQVGHFSCLYLVCMSIFLVCMSIFLVCMSIFLVCKSIFSKTIIISS